MGYTHYWKFTSEPKKIKDGLLKFSKAVILLKKGVDVLTSKYAVKLASANGKGNPIFLSSKVSFNGVGDESHEDFFMDWVSKGGFCKTARKSYDPAVCLALLCMKRYFKEDFKYSSDGNSSNEGWMIAENVYKMITGE